MKKILPSLLILIFIPAIMFGQWVSQSTGFSTYYRGIYDISIADANNVWTLAYDGLIGFDERLGEFSRTTNGGTSWRPGFLPEGHYWNSISAINGETAWVAGVDTPSYYDGVIYKTTDGGATWNEQGATTIFNSTSWADVVYFWNANEGVAIGDPNPTDYEIYTTTDGGTTWTPVLGASIPDAVAGDVGMDKVHAVVGNNIWFMTYGGKVYHSPDKGYTWTVSDPGIVNFPNDYFLDVAFTDESHGIVRLFDWDTNISDNVYETNDGGATWSAITPTGQFFGNGMSSVPGVENVYVSAGVYQGVYGSSYSNDGGQTWNTIDTGVYHFVTNFLDGTTGWSGSFATSATTDGIYKFNGQLVGIFNSENRKEIFFNAYPNPSNGNIIIELNNSENIPLYVSLYDLSGRIVFEDIYKNVGGFFMKSLNFETLTKGAYILKAGNDKWNVTKNIVLK